MQKSKKLQNSIRDNVINDYLLAIQLNLIQMLRQTKSINTNSDPYSLNLSLHFWINSTDIIEMLNVSIE